MISFPLSPCVQKIDSLDSPLAEIGQVVLKELGAGGAFLEQQTIGGPKDVIGGEDQLNESACFQHAMEF